MGQPNSGRWQARIRETGVKRISKAFRTKGMEPYWVRLSHLVGKGSPTS